MSEEKRCSLCGSVRNEDGACSFIECDDPTYDNDNEAESVSGEPPRCISCQQPLMCKDGKSWCSTSGCSAQFQPIGEPPRSEPPECTHGPGFICSRCWKGDDFPPSSTMSQETAEKLLAGSRPSTPSADPELHKVRDGVYTFAAKPEAPAPAPRAEQLAQFFHDTYERLAPGFGYETRKESAKPWSDVPEKNRNLMIAVCAEVLAHLRGK